MKRAKWISALAILAALSVFLALPSNRTGLFVVHGQQYAECISAAASPGCQSAQYGIVAIAASAQTVVVNTVAVTSTAVIDLAYDGSTSTGTLLGVTCNTSAQQPFVSARTAGSSFTIKTGSTFTTNPGCIMFHIINQ